jgi:hypothetical protein
MRTITDHIANPANDRLTINVIDEPGAGGANHIYEIIIDDGRKILLPFQNGGIAEHGVNGITQEVLLAVVIDRLASFDAGPYPSSENKEALYHARQALEYLKLRTKKRTERGVEGKEVA